MNKFLTSQHYILLIFCFLPVAHLKAQNIEAGNSFYARRNYASAIPIFEAALAKKSTNSLKSKLANCYRVLAKPDKALPLYADLAKDPNSTSRDLLHYSEVLMSLGRYDETKANLKILVKAYPEDEQAKLMYDNCGKIKTLKPYFKNVTITPFTKVEVCDDNVPVFFRNGFVFASDRPQHFQLLKEKNPVTGRDFMALYYAEPMHDTGFTEPKIFSGRLTDLNKNTSSASFTKDETRVFFCKNSEEPAKNGNYNMQLYTAETNDFEHWKKVERLPFCALETNYFYPAISPDGKMLFFVSDKGDSHGGLDIYLSKYTKKGWSRPQNLGTVINTSEHESFPYFSSDNKLYFSSKGHAGYGGYDIFFSQYNTVTETWLKPVNLGAPINSAYDDISIAFPNNSTQSGVITSNRGGHGDDIYFFKLNADIKSDSTTTPPRDSIKGYSIDADAKKN